jgi:hypothetical protein
MKLILINGKKRSGKDHFAQMMQTELDKLGKTSAIMSFADPIKEIISETFDISLEQLDQLKNDATPIGIQEATYDGYDCLYLSNFRLILQKFGTEAMKKQFGEDVWPNLLLERASKADADFILVPDFRFLCENIPGGFTVKIRNDDIEKNCTDNHRSENELNDFKFMYTLDNTGYSLTNKDVQNFIKDIALTEASEQLSLNL